MTKNEAMSKLVEFAKKINKGEQLTNSEVEQADKLTAEFQFTVTEVQFIFMDAKR